MRQAQRVEAIGQLTGGIAHDFNNLLSVMIVSLELLEDIRADDPASAPHLVRALEAGRRGAALTQRLLAFSRRQRLYPRVTDVNQLIRGTLELARRGIEENVDIQTRLADHLWPVEIDRNQLENALLNLMLNARDAIAGAGHIVLGTENQEFDPDAASYAAEPRLDAGPYVVIEVRDDGGGMSGADVERAFDPFFTTKEPGTGSGLGLSMVQGFVSQSGGAVAIDSTLGEGTVVRLFLPAATKAVEAMPEPPETGAAEGYRRGRGECVLVVEDDARVREVVSDVLTQAGYRVLTAADGASALALLARSGDVAVLFTDVVLAGGLGGVELVRRAREKWPALKALYTSGYTADAMARRGSLLDDETVLSKPYLRQDLVRAIGRCLENEADAKPPRGRPRRPM